MWPWKYGEGTCEMCTCFRTGLGCGLGFRHLAHSVSHEMKPAERCCMAVGAACPLLAASLVLLHFDGCACWSWAPKWLVSAPVMWPVQFCGQPSLLSSPVLLPSYVWSGAVWQWGQHVPCWLPFSSCCTLMAVLVGAELPNGLCLLQSCDPSSSVASPVFCPI